MHALTLACRPTSRSYVRRRPEESALYRTVQRHLAGFVNREAHTARAVAIASSQATARAVLRVLDSRGVPTSEDQRRTILDMRDDARLERWLDAALTCATTDAVLLTP